MSSPVEFDLPYSFPEHESPSVLYEGPLRIEGPNSPALEGRCQVTFEWRPKPDVRLRFASADGSPMDAIWAWGEPGSHVPPEAFVLPDVVPVQASTAAWPSGPTWSIGTGSGGTRLTLDETYRLPEIGTFEAKAVVLTLVNVPELRFGGAVVLESGGWRVQIKPHPDDATEALKRTGGYGPTHIAIIERSDGSDLDHDEYEKLSDDLWHFLGFVAGQMPGFALPVALDARGQPSWAAWQCTLVDRWKVGLNWFDLDLGDDLSSLFTSWLERSSDPFWTRVLRRVTRMLVGANRLDILDTSLTVGWTALELLAWAVLRVEQSWLQPDSGELTAAGEVRLLLSWAGIPHEIPPSLSDLRALAAARSLPDGPATLVWLRNRLTHPPRKATDDWPDTDVMFDAWRLGLEYIELIVLRLLDHQGKYGSRRYTDGRWRGQLDVVPWASDASP